MHEHAQNATPLDASDLDPSIAHAYDVTHLWDPPESRKDETSERVDVLIVEWVLDTKALVGKVPFVVVFFTSWCPVCERKMPIVRKALEGAGTDVLAIGVALDDEDTFGDVPAWVKRHGIPFRVVQGEAAPELVQALDPRGSFPVLFVVGKDGVITDVQIGIKPDHATRLEQALQVALAGPS